MDALRSCAERGAALLIVTHGTAAKSFAGTLTSRLGRMPDGEPVPPGRGSGNARVSLAVDRLNPAAARRGSG